MHPGASGQYSLDETIIAKFGKIHPAVAENFEIPTETLYFEMDFDTIFNIKYSSETIFAPISPYQPIRREFNFVLDKTTETGEIAREIEAVHPWISGVVVDDIFVDTEKVGENKKSVTFSCVILSPESTISDDEAKNIHASVIKKIESLGFKLRA